MTIYSSSRKLKISSNMKVKLLTSASINLVQEEDIVISTGTVRDNLIIKNLIDRKVVPFIITFSTASSFSPLLENFSLIVKKKIESIDNQLINEIQSIQKSIRYFETLSTKFLEKEKNLQTLKTLALYQQMQFISSRNKGVYKSTDEPKNKRRDIYLASSYKRDKAFYITLHDNDTLRVFKIAKALDANEQDFVYNIVRNNFEKLMSGEKIELRNRQYSFEYKEITQGYNKDYLLIGIDDEHDFSTYRVYDITIPQAVQDMKLYEISSDIKNIDEKGKLALESLRNIVQKKEENYRNLDIFIFSSRHFKSVISSIDYREQERFKDSMISTIFEKIYENIKNYDRKTSLLRFALVSLFSDNFESLNLKTCSHIFYDIHNGININTQLLKEVSQEKDEITYQKKILDDTLSIDDSQQKLLDTFLEQNQNQKFIQVFLRSILGMESNTQLNREKTLNFFSMTAYLGSTENSKIPYCFMSMIILQTTYNINNFFLKLDEFIYSNTTITIEEYLKKEFPYHCQENNQEVEIIIGTEKFIKNKDILRTFRRKFLLQLLRVGLFYKFISEQSIIDDIITISFSKIKNNKLNIAKLCQSKITFQFLSLFFQGHGKKDCQPNLKFFLDESRFSLEETYE